MKILYGCYSIHMSTRASCFWSFSIIDIEPNGLWFNCKSWTHINFMLGFQNNCTTSMEITKSCISISPLQRYGFNNKNLHILTNFSWNSNFFNRTLLSPFSKSFIFIRNHFSYLYSYIWNLLDSKRSLTFSCHIHSFYKNTSFHCWIS